MSGTGDIVSGLVRSFAIYGTAIAVKPPSVQNSLQAIEALREAESHRNQAESAGKAASPGAASAPAIPAQE